MWNRKLKEQVLSLKKRVAELESPFSLKTGDKVYGYLDDKGKVIKAKGFVVDRKSEYKECDSLDLYRFTKKYKVFFTGKKFAYWFFEYDLVTKKIKKNEYTEA